VDDLVSLNRKIADMEQQGSDAAKFFTDLCPTTWSFRRASSKVVGKSGPGGFIEGLKNNPFTARATEDVSVHPVGHRALVTLIVVGTRKDDDAVHRYRNIRLFSQQGGKWVLECGHNYEITSL